MKYGDVALVEYSLGEEEISHVRSSPWAVDGEESQTGEGEAVDMVVGMGDFLSGLLCGGV